MKENHAYFYNSKDGDRVYDADSMTDWLNPFFTTGVFNGELQVTANGDMSVTIAGGYCNIGGKVKNFKGATKRDLATASGTLDRIDTVILRRNDTDRDIQIIVQTGGYSPNPTPTPLARTGAYYDLKLAEIYVAAGAISITQAEITDTRMDADVCGWVCATVKEIDFSQITKQFETFFAQYKANIINQYNLYLASIGDTEQAAQKTYQDMKDKLDGLYTEYRAYLLSQYNDYLTAIGEKETAAGEAYDDYVGKIDQLFKDYETDVLACYTEYTQKIAVKETDAEADYSSFQTQLADMLQTFQDIYTEWFNHIKGQLSEDAAGNLQIEIDGIKADQDTTTEDVANLKGVVEKYVLQNREVINSLSYNQIAILMELEALTQAEVAGTSDNVVIESFDSEVIPIKGYYDSTNKRVYA